jgi:protein-S-isoprenylcysteine O-methyltransferase Ste14
MEQKMRELVMLYGVLSYLSFLAVMVYLVAFVGDFLVPKTVSSGVVGEVTTALIINICLIILWGIQHSVMARSWFKEAIVKIVPQHTERSTYVLLSAIVLAIVMYGWQPMEGVIWEVNNPFWQIIIWVLFALGWIVATLSTFLTDHFDLFGLRQTWLYFVKKSYTSVKFTERLFYHWVRHPMMLGTLMAFWATPVMTLGHLVFSLGMTVYVLMGIYFEEKALAKSIGSVYVEYQKRTSKIIPGIY